VTSPNTWAHAAVPPDVRKRSALPSVATNESGAAP